MKIIIKILIGLIILSLFLYFGLAQKGLAVKRVRMKVKYEEQEISKEEYDKFQKEYSLKDVILDPKFVFSVD